MKKFLLGTLATLAITSLPLPAQAQWVRTCTRDYNGTVNLRKGPSRSYPIIASIPNDSPVRIYSYVWGADGMPWLRIENSGLVGFIRSDFACVS
jgi:uncharacterized protein YraI